MDTQGHLEGPPTLQAPLDRRSVNRSIAWAVPVIMAVAAVVLGGGSLVGGKGTILGAFLGALVSAIMLNFLVLLGMGIWFQRFILAGIIIIVVVSARKSGRA